ncbi:NDST2 [Symbiodinium sp. CCMP2592]|nr:NDST2 [Symbiodinium sp. CCMP2592]
MGLSPASICAALAAGGGLASLAYACFYSWLWDCHLRAYPAYRGKYPRLFWDVATHILTLKRLWGFATSPLRKLPDFYIVGCPKCGTSAIYRYLALHPRIVEPAFKESRFLWGFLGLNLSALRYRSIFPIWWRGEGHLTFDADCTIAAAPKLAAALFHRLTPKAKIIMSYRDPVEAAWSMYKFRSRIKGRFDFGWTFDQMFKMEADLDASPSWAHMDTLAAALDAGASSVTITPQMGSCGVNSTLLRPQRVADVLEAFESRFGRENVLLVDFADLAADAQQTVRRIYDFLGVESTIELPPLHKVEPEDVLDMVVEPSVQ